MKKNYIIFKQFAIASSLTFSGGLAMIPMLHEELIDKHHYIDSDQFYHYVTLAQSIPGVQAATTACFLGYCINGKVGKLFAFLGAITPVLIIMTLLSILYQQLPQTGMIMYSLNALRATAGIYILEAVISMLPHIIKNKTRIKIVIPITACILIFFPISSLTILLIYCGIATLSTILGKDIL